MKQLYKFILLLALILVGNFNAFAQEVDASNQETNTSLKEQRMTISVYNNTLYIINAKENEKVDIMNMLGENILSYSIKSEDERIQLNVKKGFYIVKVGEIVQRIVVK